MPLYHKLVRDAIPNIIDQNGKKATFRTLDENEFLVEAKKKLHEELAEYEEATTDIDAVEELADSSVSEDTWRDSQGTGSCPGEETATTRRILI